MPGPQRRWAVRPRLAAAALLGGTLAIAAGAPSNDLLGPPGAEERWGDTLDIHAREDHDVPDLSRQVDADEGLVGSADPGFIPIEHSAPEALEVLGARAIAAATGLEDDSVAFEGELPSEPTMRLTHADEGLLISNADVTGREPGVTAPIPDSATLAPKQHWENLDGVPADGGDEQAAYFRWIGAAYIAGSLFATLGVVVWLVGKMSAKRQPTLPDHKPDIPMDFMTTSPLTTSLFGLTKHAMPKIEGVAYSV